MRAHASHLAHHLAAPTRLTARDLVRESIAGIAQRPGRSALTVLGTILGMATLVAVLGLTATSAAQVGAVFDAIAATTVTVTDLGDQNELTHDYSFTPDARDRITRLNGVVDAGIYFHPTIGSQPAIASTPVLDGAVVSPGLSLIAVDVGTLRLTGAQVRAGRTWDAFVEDRAERVAVLGSAAAAALNITRLDARPAVFVGRQAFTVIGILGDFQRLPELAASVLIPTTTALQLYGPPTDLRATMLIQTQTGATKLVAGQAPTALRPDNPRLFAATAPADPQLLRTAVDSQLGSLFLLLTAISVVVGAVGIANTTLVAVLERTNEIGLRRALGARPHHVATQFLAESTTLGTMGGLIGTTLGLFVVVAIAVIREWTPVVEPWTIAAAPLLGGLTGLLAGTYPALRAARIEPAVALRQ